ncbi:MAG: hypothetical protein CSA65_03130 [Proteobacteria bacterium]|nr:MAG: hypothetical protein CSB49_04215 [Pseudomonadota bacterium]PIE19129.1 MAG: hypothetical protein CSA65_03130 [Pseudomonadota bacterium]
MLNERRDEARMPLQFFLNEYIDDRPQRCMSVNLGLGGLYLNRLALPDPRLGPRRPRRDQLVGLEFELPETSETIWAAGQICHDITDRYFHGTGVRFDRMADRHRRLVRDYVLDHRERRLRQLLARIKRNRRARQAFVPR